MATIIQQVIFVHNHVFLITVFWHKQFRGAPHALVYLFIVTPALWYFMLVFNDHSNSASCQWGPDGGHAERGLAAADRGHHHPPRFLRCYGAAGTETGVPQVLEGQLWLVCGQQILLQNPFLSGTGVPQVHEGQFGLFVVSECWCIITEVLEGQLWLCLWSANTVAESFSDWGRSSSSMRMSVVAVLVVNACCCRTLFCHGAAGTGTGVTPVIELGLWSVRAVAEKPFAVMEKWV